MFDHQSGSDWIYKTFSLKRNIWRQQRCRIYPDPDKHLLLTAGDTSNLRCSLGTANFHHDVDSLIKLLSLSVSVSLFISVSLSLCVSMFVSVCVSVCVFVDVPLCVRLCLSLCVPLGVSGCVLQSRMSFQTQSFRPLFQRR